MRNQKDIILDFLKSKKKGYCDDCLSNLLQIKPRQAINILCREAFREQIINRYKGTCSYCHNNKLVNSALKGDSETFHFEAANVVISPSISDSNDFGRLTPNGFEERVGFYLTQRFSQTFTEKALDVGERKVHKFDLVSQDNSIVVECKSYTWTESGKFPSAKISTAIEAAFYLSRIIAKKKVIVFQDSLNSKGESLVDLFVRRYGGLLDDTEIWSFNAGESIDSDTV